MNWLSRIIDKNDQNDKEGKSYLIEKNDKTDKKMNFYVVDSVKGGCGKTTLALWTALELRNEFQREVCYIDLDLLGTSTEKHINQPKNKDSCYLNELFINNRRDIQKRKVINSKYFSYPTGDGYQVLPSPQDDAVRISMVFSSPEQGMKNKFRPNLPIYGNYIDYSFFARRIKELFDELYYGGFTDIVIDMPPNSDPYTDSIFDLLLNISNDKEEYSVDLHLFIVSTYDRDHIEANRQWCVDLLQKDAKWKSLSSISWFFNDVRNSIDAIHAKGQFDKRELIIVPVEPINTIYGKDINLFSILFSPVLSEKSIVRDSWKIQLIISDIE